ncbi:hypothetical protein IV203_001877 [Nitzschia inconspicua]|uniref:Uncharacterized protein n=1 Tax=Nitzschia inconspicua TaxID=303405 RepID=A0A9K3L8H8_9STRA|nr:hypothetical protein IV203_001877 [Nitzschia inconspicua]
MNGFHVPSSTEVYLVVLCDDCDLGRTMLSKFVAKKIALDQWMWAVQWKVKIWKILDLDRLVLTCQTPILGAGSTITTSTLWLMVCWMITCCVQGHGMKELDQYINGIYLKAEVMILVSGGMQKSHKGKRDADGNWTVKYAMDLITLMLCSRYWRMSSKLETNCNFGTIGMMTDSDGRNLSTKLKAINTRYWRMSSKMETTYNSGANGIEADPILWNLNTESHETNHETNCVDGVVID